MIRLGSSQSPKARPRWRIVATWLGGIVVACIVLFTAAMLIGGWTSFGQLPEGATLDRLGRSPQWHEGHFINRQPVWADLRGVLWRSLSGAAVEDVAPAAPVDVVRGDRSRFATPPATGLRITWFGHSSALVEIDGARILLDPFWGERASPVSWAGPARWYPPPIALKDLPPIDAVLISHDHYDHFDRATIMTLKDTAARFVVPLGVGSHLAYWGVPRERIIELDWWQSVKVGSVEVSATPARHASGRLQPASDKTLWAGYAIIGARHRVWYSGDTGFHTDLPQIGRRYGPFDATLIETGQYDPLWPDNHLGPELAVAAHRLVRGKAMIPVHWGLISLAPQGWTEPVERTLVAAQCASVSIVVPQPGQSVEPTQPPTFRRWWSSAQWQSALQKPVRPTASGNPSRRMALPRCTRRAQGQ
jgi:L-ascorbate metabolism protein UlaG (beta-lactamase superfamily)